MYHVELFILWQCQAKVMSTLLDKENMVSLAFKRKEEKAYLQFLKKLASISSIKKVMA